MKRLTRRLFAAALTGVLAAPAAATADGADVESGGIIDTHLHAEEIRDGGLDDVAEWMTQNGVVRGIVHPLDKTRAKTAEQREQVLARYAKQKGRIERFCILEPGEVTGVEEAVARLEQEKKDGAIGFGEHYGAGLMFDDPKNMILYAACGKAGLPVMFHMDGGRNKDEPGLPHLKAALMAHPKCLFIAHGPYWWSRFSSGDCDRLLAGFPNLYADISAGSGAGALGRDLDVTRAFMARHADRILFGTDCGWWTYGKEKKPAAQFRLMKKLKLPDEVARKIYRGNAERLFGF